MKPSEKNPAIDAALTSMFGFDRQEVIKENVCVPPPIGCGQPISNFGMWSEIEQSEYRISGFCQTCQRKVFSANYDEDSGGRTSDPSDDSVFFNEDGSER